MRICVLILNTGRRLSFLQSLLHVSAIRHVTDIVHYCILDKTTSGGENLKKLNLHSKNENIFTVLSIIYLITSNRSQVDSIWKERKESLTRLLSGTGCFIAKWNWTATPRLHITYSLGRDIWQRTFLEPLSWIMRNYEFRRAGNPSLTPATSQWRGRTIIALGSPSIPISRTSYPAADYYTSCQYRQGWQDRRNTRRRRHTQTWDNQGCSCRFDQKPRQK